MALPKKNPSRPRSGPSENSPAIYRWGSVAKLTQSAKRTAEKTGWELRETFNLSRPLHGLLDKSRPDPSTKVLGYFHIVRSADDSHLPAYAKPKAVAVDRRVSD